MEVIIKLFYDIDRLLIIGTVAGAAWAVFNSQTQFDLTFLEGRPTLRLGAGSAGLGSRVK